MDHTGDVGVVVTGRSLPELFENAAKALFCVITDRRCVRRRLEECISLEAPDLESLLVAWMGELLFLFDARGLLFRSFKMEGLQRGSLQAKAWGEPYDAGRHPIKTGVKAVTYHQIRIRENRGVWKAVVILDI